MTSWPYHGGFYDGVATFRCPKCSTEKTVDVSKYKDTRKEIKVKGKCPCGKVFTVFLDRRHSDRKPLYLSGMCIRHQRGEEVSRELITIMEMSKTGLKFKLSKAHVFDSSEEITIEFKLDDEEKTLIKKEALIRNINGRQIGCEFSSNKQKTEIESYPETLWLFLFSK